VKDLIARVSSEFKLTTSAALWIISLMRVTQTKQKAAPSYRNSLLYVETARCEAI